MPRQCAWVRGGRITPSGAERVTPPRATVLRVRLGKGPRRRAGRVIRPANSPPRHPRAPPPEVVRSRKARGSCKSSSPAAGVRNLTEIGTFSSSSPQPPRCWTLSPPGGRPPHTSPRRGVDFLASVPPRPQAIHQFHHCSHFHSPDLPHPLSRHRNLFTVISPSHISQSPFLLPQGWLGTVQSQTLRNCRFARLEMRGHGRQDSGAGEGDGCSLTGKNRGGEHGP